MTIQRSFNFNVNKKMAFQDVCDSGSASHIVPNLHQNKLNEQRLHIRMMIVASEKFDSRFLESQQLFLIHNQTLLGWVFVEHIK